MSVVELGDLVVGPLQDLLEAGFRGDHLLELHLLGQVALLQKLQDDMLQGMRSSAIGDFSPIVLGDLLLQLLQISVKIGVGHHRLHVIDQDGVAASLSDRPLGRVVGVVDVKVRQISDPDIGITVSGEADRFSRKKFQVSVGSYMHNHIRTKAILDVSVRGQILVGGRHIRIVEDLAYLTVTPRPGAASLGLGTD
ncbi:MAG: hypothetical protein A4E51_01766 [Methanosaeta sp. PtaU1.Bin055]|nr:MAG: hypothetical protein A4E51_01766 [Methanosaeta sp. PtaU1.Bin055]